MTTTTGKQDTLLTVKSIVEEMLHERFSADDITFTGIKVETLIDYTGEDYIDIKIFYSGNHDVLDSRWMLGMPRRIAKEMKNRGLAVDKVPRDTFINQEEWDEIKDWNFYDEID